MCVCVCGKIERNSPRKKRRKRRRNDITDRCAVVCRVRVIGIIHGYGSGCETRLPAAKGLRQGRRRRGGNGGPEERDVGKANTTRMTTRSVGKGR